MTHSKRSVAPSHLRQRCRNAKIAGLDLDQANLTALVSLPAGLWMPLDVMSAKIVDRWRLSRLQMLSAQVVQGNIPNDFPLRPVFERLAPSTS